MFKRGDVVQQTDTGWIGVVEYMESIQAQDGLTNYGKVIWIAGRNPPSSNGYHFTLSTHPLIEKISGYEFEAALALGDTAKALELYRAATRPTTYYSPEAESLRRAIDAAISSVDELSPLEGLTRLLALRRAVTDEYADDFQRKALDPQVFSSDLWGERDRKALHEIQWKFTRPIAFYSAQIAYLQKRATEITDSLLDELDPSEELKVVWHMIQRGDYNLSKDDQP